MVFAHLVRRHSVPFHAVVERADMDVHTWIVVNGPNHADEDCYSTIEEPWPTPDFTYDAGASSWTPDAQQDILAYFTQGVDLPWTADTTVVAFDGQLEGGITAYLATHSESYLDHMDVTVGFAPTPGWVQTGTLFAYPDGGSTYTLGSTVFLGVEAHFNGSDWGVDWGGAGLLQSGGRVIAVGGDYIHGEDSFGPAPFTANLKLCDGRMVLHLGGVISTVGTFPDNWAWSSREDDIWQAALGVGGITRPAPTAWYMALFDYNTGLELDPAIHLGYARQSVTWGAITDAAVGWPNPSLLNSPMRGFQVVSLADVVWTAAGDWPRIAVAGLVKGASAVFDAERPQLWCQYIGTSIPLPAGSSITVPAGIFKVFVY